MAQASLRRICGAVTIGVHKKRPVHHTIMAQTPLGVTVDHLIQFASGLVIAPAREPFLTRLKKEGPERRAVQRAARLGSQERSTGFQSIIKVSSSRLRDRLKFQKSTNTAVVQEREQS
jgi:hypothetical protein